MIALVLPAAAPAAQPDSSKSEVQRASTSVIALLGMSRGYQIGILFPNSRVAVLFATKLDVSDQGLMVASSGYAVHTHNGSPDGVLRARFRTMGRVTLHFKPNGRVRAGHNPKGCEGRRPVTESGRFRGKVSLEGEGGYFHISTSGGGGILSRSFRLKCRRGHAEKAEPVAPLRHYVAPSLGTFFFSPDNGSVALLRAVARTGGRYVELRASHRAGSPPGAEVQVGTLEERPGMAIGRSAWVEGGAGTLLTSLPGAHPATATLAPPAPFHGEADFFENSARSHSWTGSLHVSLPGLDLPLTGPDFATSLCVLSPLKSSSGCDFAKPKPLVPVQLGASAGARR